jgi:hypothetical protein
LPEERYFIFHGLRLRDKKEFQMDILILSRTFALIVEVKNIAGKLKFRKGSDQVIQEYEQQAEIGLPNPISQVKRQRIQFLNWLRKMKIKALPVEYLVVISKTSTIIETTPDNLQIYNHLIFAEALIDKIHELENKYPTPHLNNKNIVTLAENLLKEHIHPLPNILKEYKMTPTDLFPGVLCPCCKKVPMKYISAKWSCLNCKTISKSALLQALDDYFLLIATTITRKQFREFLQIETDLVAKHQLRALNLAKTSTTRGTKYFLPPGCILSHLDENAIEKGEYVIP